MSLSLKDYVYSEENSQKKVEKGDWAQEISWEKKKNACPAVVELETISTCNLKCPYCPNSKYARRHQRMSEEDFKRIIDELHDWGFQGFLGTAFLCEPLTDERCLSLFSYARKKLPLAKMHLTTNGTLLTPELLKNLLDNAFHTMRITQHTKVLKNEPELAALLEKYPEYINSVTVLRPGWTPLNYAGEVDGEYAPYRKQCAYYNIMTIDCYGQLVMCCRDIFGKNKYGSLSDGTLQEMWIKSEPVRRLLYTGKHNQKLPICHKCVGEDSFKEKIKNRFPWTRGLKKKFLEMGSKLGK
ncbi:MAG: radical SAM protein [Candidatus Omnitrophica bacterium]|nr:radical SAM protein [Candidatus Omnitrophota bacterium]